MTEKINNLEETLCVAVKDAVKDSNYLTAGGYLSNLNSGKSGKEPDSAASFLIAASMQLKLKGQLRDKPQGERNMADIVKTFNSLTGLNLTEANGWEFMVILKMVRGRQGSYNNDDFVDGAAYFGLLGECQSTTMPRKE